MAINQLNEVFHSIKQHKFRNMLTGFGVAWGIFILIILLAVGQGFQDGVFKLFSSFSKNSLWVYGGEFSEYSATSNRPVGSPVLFSDKMLTDLSLKFDEVKFTSLELNLSQNVIASWDKKSQFGSLKGVSKNYFKIKSLSIDSGRMFNHLDFKQNIPVCIVGSNIANVLSKENNLIGKWINISGVFFKVIGVIEKGTLFSQNEQNVIYITDNAFRSYFNRSDSFSVFGVLLDDNLKNNQNIENLIKNFLAEEIGFNSKDEKALFVVNINEQIGAFNKLFNGIKLFLWFVGVSILLSGIIGISNIMLVIVKERTYEIGIRKAVGATSRSILYLFLSESILITTLSGLIGMSFGTVLVWIGNIYLKRNYAKDDFLIASFEIHFSIIISALMLLIIAGTLAGLIPAKKASEVSPISALKNE